MAIKKALLFLALFFVCENIFSQARVECFVGRNNDFYVENFMPFFPGSAVLMDVEANSLNGDFIQGRVESLAPIRFGELNAFRTVLYINLFQVTYRNHYVLIIPFGRNYFSTIRFEGISLGCRTR